MIVLSACDPALVDDIWPIASPFLRRSYIKNDQAMPAWLKGDLKSGKRQLWLLHDVHQVVGAGVTAIFDMVSGKMCKIEHFGGEGREDWSHLRSVIEQYAKAEGCVKVLCEGRPGWSRILSDYDVTAVVLEKRL